MQRHLLLALMANHSCGSRDDTELNDRRTYLVCVKCIQQYWVNNRQCATRSCKNTVGNLRAIAHILSTANTYRRTKVTAMSCTMQRNAEIASEIPTLSCSTSEITELRAMRAKAIVTCDQLGCETKVGCDMGVCC